MQTKFKTKECYFEWRSYWRRQYKGCTMEIRHYKKLLKHKIPAHNTLHSAYFLLRRQQMVARNLMLAREAVERDYRYRLACENAKEQVTREVEGGCVEVYDAILPEVVGNCDIPCADGSGILEVRFNEPIQSATETLLKPSGFAKYEK